MTPTLPDWPAMIRRLEARKINIRAVLKVSKVTLWKWRTRTCKPSGDHAASLIALDMGGRSTSAE